MPISGLTFSLDAKLKLSGSSTLDLLNSERNEEERSSWTQTAVSNKDSKILVEIILKNKKVATMK